MSKELAEANVILIKALKKYSHETYHGYSAREAIEKARKLMGDVLKKEDLNCPGNIEHMTECGDCAKCHTDYKNFISKYKNKPMYEMTMREQSVMNTATVNLIADMGLKNFQNFVKGVL